MLDSFSSCCVGCHSRVQRRFYSSFHLSSQSLDSTQLPRLLAVVMDVCRNEELLTQLNWRGPSHSASTTHATAQSLSPPPSPIPDRFTFIKSTLATPADFLLLSWLACRLHAGEHVLLLHTARSRQHYLHVGRKWNVNVAAAEAAGQLTLVDAYTLDTTQQHFTLHTQLLRAVHSATQPLHLAIDDLTLLTLLTAPGDLHAFLSTLRTLSASLLLVAPSDIASQRLLHSHCSQLADCLLSLSALRTGVSREVDGVLEVVKRDVWTGVASSRVVLFYRLQANGVQLSNKGTQT